MLKKLLPVIVLVFLTACADMQGATCDMNMPCCEKCECCKDGKCSECCKDGSCKMCMMKDKSSMKKGEHCPECAKAEREWQTKHGHK